MNSLRVAPPDLFIRFELPVRVAGGVKNAHRRKTKHDRILIDDRQTDKER